MVASSSQTTITTTTTQPAVDNDWIGTRIYVKWNTTHEWIVQMNWNKFSKNEQNEEEWKRNEKKKRYEQISQLVNISSSFVIHIEWEKKTTKICVSQTRQQQQLRPANQRLDVSDTLVSGVLNEYQNLYSNFKIKWRKNDFRNSHK